MDENCSVFPEANGEVVEEQCKRRQSGILKASRSPLRTIKEIDISQKLVPVGKLRRSSRRVSFAETKEIKEFVTDKIIHADVEDDETISTLHCKQNMETYNTRDSEKENLLEELGRDMMPQDTNFKIAGMDALLHAPLRTSLQSECCEHPQTFSKHQTFTISGLEVRRDEETVTSSESKFSPEFQKKLDFRCFLAELNSTKPPSSNMRHGKEEEISDMLFSSDRHNTVPKHQKTIDFKSFFSTVKQTETENRIISMHSTFEEQVYKQADLLVTSPCKAVELTNHSMFQNHAISNLDANKTILFPDHDNDTEITRSHTVPITNLVLGKFDTCHSVNNTEKLGNRGSLSLFLPQDKAVVFSGEDFTGVTRNTIEPNDVQMIENLTNQNQPTVVTAKRNERSILPSSSSDGHAFTGFEFLGKSEQNKARGTTKQTSRSLDMSCYPNKTLLFLNDNDMDITKSHTVTIDNASFRKVPISTAGSSTFVPCDKTKMFSEANDMDIMQSHTVAIESDHLGQVSNKPLQPTRKNSRQSVPGSLLASLPNEKTVVFSEANVMDLTRSHTVTIDNGSLGPVPLCRAGSNASFPCDKTRMFSRANDMDITQSHTVAIESDRLERVSNKLLQSTRKNSRLSIPGSILTLLPNEKTMEFSEANDMDLTKSHTLNIDNANLGSVPICTAGSSVSFPCDKTKTFSEVNDMDITQSHTVAIESDRLERVSNKPLQTTRKNSRPSVPGSILASLPNEKTVVFSEANVMDLTRSHTVTIDNGSLGPVPICTAGSSAPFPCDKTRMFSKANDMDITQSHTVAIESDRPERVSNKPLQTTRTNSRPSVPGSILASLPNEKTVVFSEANVMDLTRSHTVTIDNGSLGAVPICTTGSSASFPCDKTMMFSKANDMDITQSHTIAIESDRLERVSNKPLQTTRKNSRPSVPGSILASLPNEKTVVFSEANVMDLTRSHTVTIDNGRLGAVPICTTGSSASFPCDKTMMFSKANDMDITQSHTIAIESDRLERVSNKPLQTTRKNSRPSVPGSILASLPNEKTLVFSEANVMDLTRRHTVTIDNGRLGAVPICTTGSSASFPCDKTRMFSKANDMDITQSHTVAIESDRLEGVSNKPLQTTRKNSRPSVPGSILASLPNEKTLVFSEANVMDLTRSHTVTIDNGSLGAVPICTTGSSASFPCDKTSMFSKANDMDITQSHTVAIESDRLERVSNKPLQTTRKNSRPSVPGSILASLPNEKTVVFSEANVMDLTRSHTVTIDNASLGPICTAGSSASFPCDKTKTFSEVNDMDITQSHKVAIESDHLGQVSNKPLQSTMKNSRLSLSGSKLASLSNKKTMMFSEANDIDLTRSHTVRNDNGGLGSMPICTVVSSAPFPCDKTESFSEKNDTDTTKSHTVTIEIGSPGPAAKLTVSSAGCIPIGKSIIFSEANHMNPTKSCTIDTDSGSLGTVANGAFCSAKMTSNSNTDGSVLSSYSNKKSMVSDQVAVISTVDKLPVHRRHDESGKSTVTQMMHEKGQNYFSDQMENGNCNMESNLDADSMCITELHEKSNLKGTKQSVPSTENSHTSVTLKHLEVQQKALIDQSREAASEEFVQYQVTECSAHGSGTESADTTKHKDGCDVSRKSSLSNVSSLLKMNCMKPTMGGDVPADCQTLNARPCFPKQNSLVKDTLMSQIALGVFLPKLPSRIVNSNHQNVVKSSVEHLCSDSLLNVTCKAEDLEGSNIPEPNDNLQEQPHKMQVSDCDEVESKTLDWVKPSCSLKSSAVHTLAIDKQQCEEVSSVPAQDINAIGQALIHSKTISTMEQRPNQKRVWSEEESGNACGERKMMRTSEREGTDSSRKEVCITPVVQWEGVGHERGENNLPNLTTKSQESIISLDSTKGDGTSAHAIPPKCNLNTSLVILEESELHKKLMDGEVTVREFFKFFKVQIRAQKSRQSELHVNPELDKSSGLENWLAVKFVHRPKREVYEEDSIALSAAINDQKDQLLDLDKLLAEVNFPLLKEVMQMTKEELQQFRPCLNAKKTTFVKRTKVICHEQKVQLYLSQLNALKTQRQQRKEYEDYLDDMINKMDDCLASLDLGNLGPLVECSMDDIDHDESLMQLKQIVNERHEDLRNLQAEHSKMESELAKVLGEKSQQENAAKMLELNEEFQELLEWTLLPCQDDQAVYSFLYGSLELTLQYGKAEDADLSPGEKCRILDVKVVSQLDEEETPAHSKLVHELILTYWKNRDSWHQTHSKESQLPMLLLDLSLVVSRCRVLGDELEYLLNWGSKFDILKTQIQHMDVKFLFSSYEALSKFEVTFHIMPGYPWLPLQFTFNSWFGNISGEHINKVLLTVKPGHEYLIRIMKSLFLTLLTRPGANRFVTTGLFLTRKR